LFPYIPVGVQGRFRLGAVFTMTVLIQRFLPGQQIEEERSNLFINKTHVVKFIFRSINKLFLFSLINKTQLLADPFLSPLWLAVRPLSKLA
jgi:hypothetical protein